MRDFDGIVCIGGEDWWYHNRGHFDFQIMRRIARTWPVLFVNSLGVRMPSLSADPEFSSRISRKLKSLARGLSHVENDFWVFSPLLVPGAIGHQMSSFALGPQIAIAARRAGIRKPLLWIHCPAGAPLAGRLNAAATVMQRTDRFEAFPEAHGPLVAEQIAHLKRSSDLVVYANPALMAEETQAVKRQVLVTHGVDLTRFVEAGLRTGAEPQDVRALPRPRVAFVGGIDKHTFDPPLFLDVVRRLPDVHFLMVGGCSLSPDWCTAPNVTFTGRKPYDEVPEYMAAADVLIMPWNDSDWIKACNPIKLKEYLATGRPIVSTDFPALEPWRDMIAVATTAEAFAIEIRKALQRGRQPAPLARLAGESWDDKALLVQHAILDLGVRFAPSQSRGANVRTGKPAAKPAA